MLCTKCGRDNQGSAQTCYACGQAFGTSGAPSVPRASSATMANGRLPLPQSGMTAVYHEPAGFWIRLAATVLDGFIIGGLCLAGAALFGGIGMLSDSTTAIALAVVGYYVSSIVMPWLYAALTESSAKQATLGKRAVGIFVTDADGDRISFARATGRSFAKYLNVMSFGVGYLLAAFTDQKRGLHDMVASTLVVRRHGQSSNGVVVGVLCAFAMVPVIGIVAAIAIPGLLRARTATNEVQAICSLRQIVSAQDSYLQRCSGYAPDLSTLVRGKHLAAQVTAAESMENSGYHITLAPAVNDAALTDVPSGCEGAVSQYSAVARPTIPGSTGRRFFFADYTGVIYQDTSEAFSNPTPIQ